VSRSIVALMALVVALGAVGAGAAIAAGGVQLDENFNVVGSKDDEESGQD
jgi:hypothetical protein